MKRETELSKALRKWQEREKLNQPSAAAKLGVPFGSYRNWVGGRRVPSAATLAHIESVTKQKAA